MFTKEIFLNPFIQLWDGLILTLPRLILAILIFMLGWFIGKVAYKGIVKLSNTLKLDETFKPMAGAIERAGYRLQIGKVIGFFIQWFVVIGTLTIALDILGLQSTKSMLMGIIAFIPQIILAMFLLMAGIVVAGFVKKLILASTKMLNVKAAAMLANLTRVAIIIFTSLVALNLVGFSSEIINILFTGLVVMVALAGGLAFGLGGQKAAAEAIEDIKSSMRK